MPEVLTVGEILVEIMREQRGIPLGAVGTFRGPYPSGAPAIFIDAVANLGHSCAIVGGVGDDEFGQLCLQRLRNDGVDTSGVKVNRGLSTAVAFVAYEPDGSRKFIFHLRGSAATSVGSLPDSEVASVKLLHVMGCSLMIDKGLADQIASYAAAVKRFGGKVSFDPNVRAELMTENYIRNSIEQILSISDIVLPGASELELLAGSRSAEDGVGSLFERGVGMVVLKQGARGCTIYSRELAAPINVPSFEVQEIDPTGAGDSFDAGFICGLLEGKDLRECGVLANACGALNATRFGPMEGVFRREIVEGFIQAKGRGL